MTVLKVCGATTVEDVDEAADGGADLVGLWYGVPDGPRELTATQVTRLAGQCRRRGVAPVLVTLSHDVDDLARVTGAARIGHVQLHAYQPPLLVGRLTRRSPGLEVIKVLHVDRARCPEAPFLTAYERAGVRTFLVDRTSAGRVGSTGTEVPPGVFGQLADRCTVPLWLAGGLSATTDARRIGQIRGHPRFAGLDVDSAARRGDGTVSAAAVAAVARSWRAGPRHRLTLQPDRTPS